MSFTTKGFDDFKKSNVAGASRLELGMLLDTMNAEVQVF